MKNNGDVGGEPARGAASLFLTDGLTLPTLVQPQLSNTTGRANGTPHPPPHTVTKAPSKSISSARLSPQPHPGESHPHRRHGQPCGNSLLPWRFLPSICLPLTLPTSSRLLYSIRPTSEGFTQHTTICQQGPR